MIAGDRRVRSVVHARSVGEVSICMLGFTSSHMEPTSTVVGGRQVRKPCQYLTRRNHSGWRQNTVDNQQYFLCPALPCLPITTLRFLSCQLMVSFSKYAESILLTMLRLNLTQRYIDAHRLLPQALSYELMHLWQL